MAALVGPGRRGPPADRAGRGRQPRMSGVHHHERGRGEPASDPHRRTGAPSTPGSTPSPPVQAGVLPRRPVRHPRRGRSRSPRLLRTHPPHHRGRRTARMGDGGAGRGVGRPPAVDHRPVLAHSTLWTRPRPPQPDLLPGHRTWSCGPPGKPPVRAAPLVDGTRHALLPRRRQPDADHRHTHPRRRGPDRRRTARVPRRRPATPARGRRPTTRRARNPEPSR
jgi:hypothetical protein